MLIKYRVFDKENNCWLSQSFHKHIMIRSNGTLTWWSGKDKFNDFASDRFDVSVFTGQIDKNGRAICSGDFLSGDYPDEVFFDEGRGQWMLRNSENPDDTLWEILRENKPKVIGNVHENPELLEGRS